MFWFHSKLLSFLPCIAPNNSVAWKSNVRLFVYVFFKNVLKSSQFSIFLCVIATCGSPLILVNTNLCSTFEFSVLITSKAVPTFEINANTSLLSPLNGLPNFSASPIDILYIQPWFWSKRNLWSWPSICCPWHMAPTPSLRLAAAHRSAVHGGCRLLLVHRVNVKRLATFRTVSMDVLRLDHHASDTIYACCIPGPRRAVSRDFGIILWSNVQSSNMLSPFIVVLGCRLALRPPTTKVTAFSLPEVNIIHRVTG